jgi:hypothetical protein
MSAGAWRKHKQICGKCSTGPVLGALCAEGLAIQAEQAEQAEQARQQRERAKLAAIGQQPLFECDECHQELSTGPNR